MAWAERQPRASKRRLATASALSLVAHGFVLLIQFGEPGEGWPFFEVPWGERRAVSVDDDRVGTPAEPVPAMEASAAVPPSDNRATPLAALPAMRARGGGSLLSPASTSGLTGSQFSPVYNIAKFGVVGLVHGLSKRYARENIRVNAVSAGPIKTVAASGIGDFRYILRWNQLNSPMQRNVTIEEVGGAGVYLVSDLSRGVTGEVHHVDCGYNIVGMKNPDAPDIAIVES